MSSGLKCKSCGSTDVEADSSISETVCTHCGLVLQNNLISEVEYGSGAILGKFVWTESINVNQKTGMLKTITKAKWAITHYCNQLHLNHRCIETALHFFKMAHMKKMTRYRDNRYICAVCVFMSCRIDLTSHLLTDFSDILQMCVKKLRKTYKEITRALSVSIPLTDHFGYVMRLASRMEFGDKTHEVAMTADRIIQRMKKDHIHTGRILSGYCGAALLLAARMHEFSRTVKDIARIVEVKESTLRKRLVEFGSTPSSELTLVEFMTVDLESEEDPPAFKWPSQKPLQFHENQVNEQKETNSKNANPDNGESELEGLDEDEIDFYILSEEEVKCREIHWNAMFGDEETIMKSTDCNNKELQKQEVAKNVIHANVSRKINYDVLKTITEMKTVKESSFDPEENSNISTAYELEMGDADTSNVVCDPTEINDVDEDENGYFYSESETEQEPQYPSLANLLCNDDRDIFTYG